MHTYLRISLLKLCLFLFLAVALLACSSEDSSNTNLTGAQQSSNPSSTENAPNGEESLNTEVSIDLASAYARVDGQLAVVRGTTLEINPLDGSPPQVLDDTRVKSATLGVPANSSTLYFNAGSTRYRLHRLNIETMQIEQVVRVSGEYAFPLSLSPDGEWVLIANFPNWVVGRTDGSDERMNIAPIGGSTALWFGDNRLLVIDPQLQSSGPNLASIIDPSTRESTTIDPLLTEEIVSLTLNSTVPTDILALQELVQNGLGVELAFAPSSEEEIANQIAIVGPPTGGFGSTTPLCEEWQIQEVAPDGNTETLFVAPQTLFLNNALQAADGNIFVEHWYLQDCDNNQRRVDLLKIAPDGESTVVLEGIDNGVGTNYGFFFGDNANRTALSPDGTVIAWLGGGIEAGFSTLNLYFIDDNSNIELERIERDSSNASDFHIEAAFTAIAWLP